MQFEIDNMACGGCAKGVIKAIHSVDPQATVGVDLNLKRVTVESGADQSTVAVVLQAPGFRRAVRRDVLPAVGGDAGGTR